jgi:uncharacterized protein YkwD
MKPLLLSLSLLLAACGGGDPVCPSVEKQMAEINKTRSQPSFCSAPAGPVAYNAELQQVAQRFADELAANKIQAGHIGADGSTLAIRMNRSSYSWLGAAENTAAGHISAENLVEGFKNSPGHCQNMYTTFLTDVGPACAENDGRLYWVHVFSKSR